LQNTGWRKSAQDDLDVEKRTVKPERT